MLRKKNKDSFEIFEITQKNQWNPTFDFCSHFLSIYENQKSGFIVILW